MLYAMIALCIISLVGTIDAFSHTDRRRPKMSTETLYCDYCGEQVDDEICECQESQEEEYDNMAEYDA